MNWERFFSEKILARGLEYYKQHTITHLETIHDTVHAIVSGSEPYHVTIKMKSNDPIKWNCTCPYIENHTECKHITAVLYAIEADQKEQNYACNTEVFLRLKNLPENKAKQLLLELIAEQPELADNISKKLSIISPEKIKEIKQKIRQALQRASGKYRFIEYDNAHRLLKEFMYIMEYEIALFIQKEHLLTAFELLCYMLEQYFNYEIDDSNGETQELFIACTMYWKQIIEQANDEQEEQMYKVIHKLLAKKIDSDFYSFLFETEINLFTTPAILKKNLILLEEKIQHIKEQQDKSIRGYMIGNYIVLKINIMEQLKYPDEDIQLLIHEYWQNSFVRSTLAAKALEKEHFYNAIQILEESKEIDCDYPSYLNEYTEQLIALYEKTNQPKKLKEELVFGIFHTYFHAAYLSKLKKITNSKEWNSIIQKITATEKLKTYFPYIYKLENNWNELLTYVFLENSLEVLTTWENDLKKYFPNELCKLYQTLLLEKMKNAANRKEYAYIINYFKKIAAYPHGKEIIFYLTNTWKQRYPRRKAMIDELDKFKY